MRAAWVVLGLAILLVGLAIVFPSNTLTGRVIQDGPCKGLGCVELCDQGNSTCHDGTVCCPTHWNSGVCDYAVNCEKIREYSLYQTIETYQDSVREQPAPVDTGWSRFFLPLVLCLGIIVYFMVKREDPELAFKK